MDKIIDGLYLGDIRVAANLFMLKQAGITHVLQIVAGLNPCFPNDFVYKVVPALDVPWENLAKHFGTCNKFISNVIHNNGSVFVHCYGGVSRSPTIVIAYLMQEHKMNFFSALNFVRQRRPVTYPNAGF
jgi:atypical dual specificity phosphatase